MIRYTSLFIILLLSSNLFAQKVWSLEECINYAFENNIQVKQLVLNEQVNKNYLVQSKADLAPDINASAGYNVNFGRSIDPTTNRYESEQFQSSVYSANSNIILFNGLRQLNTIKQNQFNLQSSHFSTEDYKNNITLTVTSSYLQILLNKEEIKTLNHQVSLTLEQLKQTRILVDAGTLPEGNVFDVEAQLASDSLNIIRANNALILNKLNLQLLLQLDPSEAFDVTSPPINLIQLSDTEILSSNDLYKEALTTQPIIKKNQFDILSAEKGLQIAKGLRYPSLNFSFYVRTNHSSLTLESTDDILIENTYYGTIEGTGETFSIDLESIIPGRDGFSVGEQYKNSLYETLSLGLSIPIFNGLTTHTTVKNAELNVLSANYETEMIKNELKNEVYKAQADAIASLENYKASEKTVKALQTRYDYIESSFDLGATNALDFSIAKTNLTNSQINTLRAKYEYVFKLKVLDIYLGKPITLD